MEQGNDGASCRYLVWNFPKKKKRDDVVSIHSRVRGTKKVRCPNYFTQKI